MKTRIKMIERADGKVEYIPQYYRGWLRWGDIETWNDDMRFVENARKRIETFLSDDAKQKERIAKKKIVKTKIIK